MAEARIVQVLKGLQRRVTEGVVLEFYGENQIDPDKVSTDEILHVLFDGQSDDTLDGLPIVLVESNGGGEGEGEHVDFVVRHGETFAQLNAFYNSWDGIDWEVGDVYEVRPKEILKTVYVSVVV